jgi:hypothetical protein
MINDDSRRVNHVIENYFQGIYSGDVRLLESTLHKDALLFGDINGTPYFKKLTDYIRGVRERKSPKELGEKFQMKVVSLEITNSLAVAKLSSPMFGFNYIDYLSIHKIEDDWLIVNKLFTKR